MSVDIPIILKTIQDIPQSIWDYHWSKFPLFEYTLFDNLEKQNQFYDCFRYIRDLYDHTLYYPFYSGSKTLKIRGMCGKFLTSLLPNFIIFGHPLLGAISASWMDNIDLNQLLRSGLTNYPCNGVIILDAQKTMFTEKNIFHKIITFSSGLNSMIDITDAKDFNDYLNSFPPGERKTVKNRYRGIRDVSIKYSRLPKDIELSSIFFSDTERKAKISFCQIDENLISAVVDSLPNSTISTFSHNEKIIGVGLIINSRGVTFVKRIGINYSDAGTKNITILGAKSALLSAFKNKNNAVNLGRTKISCIGRIKPTSIETAHAGLIPGGVSGNLLKLGFRILKLKRSSYE